MRLILSCHIHLCARLSVLKCFKVLKDLGVGFWDWGRDHNTGDYLSIHPSIPNSVPRSSLVTQELLLTAHEITDEQALWYVNINLFLGAGMVMFLEQLLA